MKWFVACSLLAAAQTLGCSSADPILPDNSGGTAGAGGEGGGLALGGQAGSSGAGGNAGGGASNAGGQAGTANGGSETGGVGGVTIGGAGGSSGSGGSAPEPSVRWLGRVAPKANGARMSWSGTGFVAHFQGTDAHATVKTDNVDYFEIEVDGVRHVLTTQAGSHDYDLTPGLGSGEHSLTFWRRTEPNNGAVDVGPISFTGTLLAPLPAPTRRLEIVGDSISVGYGTECKTSGEAFTYATENNYITYEAIAARTMAADLVVVAWSGLGMYRPCCNQTGDEMPARYLTTIPNDADKWDFSRYTPDAVLVNLGTNDFGMGDPGAPFQDAYVAFVTGVRSRYAAAHLYLAVSPMLSGDKRTQQKAYLNNVLSARSKAGDKNLSIIEFAEPAADGWACGHPNAATHAIMATAFENALKADLGW